MLPSMLLNVPNLVQKKASSKAGCAYLAKSMWMQNHLHLRVPMHEV
jgi:hypothetical protein